MEKLKFYDMKAHKTFHTDNWEYENKGGRTFAVAETPSGGQAWRAMKKQQRGE